MNGLNRDRYSETVIEWAGPGDRAVACVPPGSGLDRRLERWRERGAEPLDRHSSAEARWWSFPRRWVRVKLRPGQLGPPVDPPLEAAGIPREEREAGFAWERGAADVEVYTTDPGLVRHLCAAGAAPERSGWGWTFAIPAKALRVYPPRR
ncbi:MAG: hypothetical protein IMW98_10105, partial [Firmicutes bacterium]|nr:hypothetical protein [Bacillota bacterium]